MEIKKVSKEEFQTLMSVMNQSFKTSKDSSFEKILPKLYYPTNNNMIHYAVYENQKMVASVGLYPMTLISENKTLNAVCLGGIGTLPEHRLKGYFKALMEKAIDVCKNSNYDLIFLNGKRQRYNNFGFENAGRKMVVTLSYKKKKLLQSKTYEVKPLVKEDKEMIKACLDIYNLQPQRMLRTEDNFYDHVVTWGCKPYVVKVGNKVVAYFSAKRDHIIFEIGYLKGYRDTLLNSILGDKPFVAIYMPISEYDDDLFSKIENYNIKNCCMYKILNWNDVATFLNFNQDYQKEFDNLSEMEKTRYGLGNELFESRYGKSIYISLCDEG